MNRRTFVHRSLSASLALGTLGTVDKLFPSSLLVFPLPFDLVAVKGGEPEQMFLKGIEALGGMRAFVKKGQTVVVKPNIGWDVSPERAGNTNPKLVVQIIKQCRDAGAKDVYVFDHTCDNWQRCYKNSGIESAVKEAGGKIAPGHSEGYYHDVAVSKGKVLKKAKEHELILQSDVFINVPILKSHSSARMTAAMKNLMGIVWDRGYWHREDLHQCIADYGTYRKPDLNIVDAYAVMRTNGPRGISTDDVTLMKAQLISTDMLAVDAAAAKMFGVEPDDVPYIPLAAELNVGRKDLEKLNIKRITV